MSDYCDFEINDDLLDELLEQEIDQTISKDSSKNKSNHSIKTDKNDISNCFKNLNFYVEIFNKTIDQSDLLDEMIKSNGGNVKFKFILTIFSLIIGE
jgi:hypothetical protein